MNPERISNTKENTYVNKIEPVDLMKKFLIAEDEEVNFFYLEIVLKKLVPNCIVDHALNGSIAVEKCTFNGNYDMIFMDIRMPQMDGFEATRIIKQMQPSVPVIMQTAFTSDEDRKNAAESGCDGFLTKPISEFRLKELLGYLL